MIKLLRMLTRIAGLGALILGIMLWRGGFASLLGLHMTLGWIVALVLAILAVSALSDRALIPRAIVSLIWAAVTVYVGMMRNRGIAGEIIHLLLGIGAIGLAEMMAGGIARKRGSLA